MTIGILVRVYEELNQYLPAHVQKKEFMVQSPALVCVQDVIDLLKIPLEEVDLILVNGESVDISHPCQPNDRISIYPVFETLNIAPLVRLRPKPLRTPRFVCDVHLGTLAKYLRMMGIDAAYQNPISRHHLIELSNQEKRIILSKDTHMRDVAGIVRAYYVVARNLRQQVREIISYFELKDSLAPLSRCLRCNGKVWPVDKKSLVNQVPEKILALHNSFMKCHTCGRIYWKGSHFHAMMDWIQRFDISPSGI